MHVAAALSHNHDAALTLAVELTAELITEWRNPANERYMSARSSEPLIYRVARPPFTQAAGVAAAKYATQLIYDAGITDEPALVDNAFRIGMGSGIHASRIARGETIVFPPRRETLGEWILRIERELSDWLLTKLLVDPPPGDDLRARAVTAHCRAWAQRLRCSATSRTAARAARAAARSRQTGRDRRPRR